jgi:antitoxin ParD1/3/4
MAESADLGEGVRLVQGCEARLAALDASIERGLADAHAGRMKPSSEPFNRLEAKLATKANRE